MSLTPAPEYIQTEVIMDGRILGENLKRLGRDENWLQKQLHQQHYKDAREVFLGVPDHDEKSTLFPK